MKFARLVEDVADLPLFRASLLLAGDRDPADVRRQLSRWTAAGKVVQLRRDVYVLAEPWRRVAPHPFLVANELHRPSYVSLQAALAYHGLIPEAVPVTTSVTTARPTTLDTPLGRYTYRHVQAGAFFGYRRTAVWGGQEARVADAAKALLDLVYLTPGGESMEHLESLRLEGLESVPAEDFRACARRWGKPKLDRAVRTILALRERG
jgi:predicted transcriptional regulator of viral defense system